MLIIISLTIYSLYWNHAEKTQRTLSKNPTILDHWGKNKPDLKLIMERNLIDEVLEETEDDNIGVDLFSFE